MTSTGWVIPLDGPVQVVSSIPSSAVVKVASSSDAEADCASTSASPPVWVAEPTMVDMMRFPRSPLVFTRTSERLKTSPPADARRIVGTRRMAVRPSHRLARPGQREGSERASRAAPPSRATRASAPTTTRVVSEVSGMFPITLIACPSRPGPARPRVRPRAWTADRRRLSQRVWPARR